MKLLAFLSMLVILLALFGRNNGDEPCKHEAFLQPGVSYAIQNYGYPIPYVNNSTSCQWVLKTSWDQRVKIDCNDIDIPSNWYCGKDRLEIQDGAGGVARLCSRQQFPYISESSRLTVTVRTFPNNASGSFHCTAETVKSTECDCGRRNIGKIKGISGESNGVNEYPFMVAIVDTNRPRSNPRYTYQRTGWAVVLGRMKSNPREKSEAIVCSGTIINKKQVLTAAHCVCNLQARNMKIITAEYMLKKDSETPGEHILAVEKTMVHPSFTLPDTGLDVAIITIVGEFHFGETISPICLPFQHLRDFVGALSADVLGWEHSGGGSRNFLNKAMVSIETTETCKRHHPYASDKYFCTLKPRSESCQFTSGGPLILQSETSRKVIQIGIARREPTCDDDLSLNTEVEPFIDWIVNLTPQGINYCKSQ